MFSRDVGKDSRWKDEYSSSRVNIAIYDLINAENVRARSIAAAYDGGDLDLARQLSEKGAPIAEINELLRLSSLPIVISIRESDQVIAAKAGSKPFSIAELSDGERNAVLIAANVLTVKPDTLLLIDEPERHLHRSIISPLLTQLFAKRRDCAFVVATHEITLPVDSPYSQTLLVRSCTYSSNPAAAWEADLLPPDAEIDEELKKDILGARRRMLFVEGRDSSLDKPLYSLVFPNVSVVAKATCREVEHAVASIRDARKLHWLDVFGIVDNDGRSLDDIKRLKMNGVYALEVFSVESVYYHPEIQRAVVERHANLTGEDGHAQVEAARIAAVACVRAHAQRMSERVAEKLLRDQLFKRLPGKKEMTAAKPVSFILDVPGMIAIERARLENAIEANDLASLVARYPLRETGALSIIAGKLGFRDRIQYESTVRRLLMDDEKMLNFVRSLFDTLAADVGLA